MAPYLSPLLISCLFFPVFSKLSLISEVTHPRMQKKFFMYFLMQYWLSLEKQVRPIARNPGEELVTLIEKTQFCWKNENMREDSPPRISTSTVESPLYSFNCLQICCTSTLLSSYFYMSSCLTDQEPTILFNSNYS